MKTEIIIQGFQDKKTLWDKDRLCSKIVENVKNFVFFLFRKIKLWAMIKPCPFWIRFPPALVFILFDISPENIEK